VRYLCLFFPSASKGANRGDTLPDAADHNTDLLKASKGAAAALHAPDGAHHEQDPAFAADASNDDRRSVGATDGGPTILASA
jgi:hypothetical protein